MVKIYDYFTLCSDVMKLDSKIRFAGIINERGRLVSGGMKKGIQPMSSEKDDETMFMELALRVKMRREFDKQLGCVKFSLSLREAALAMSFPIGSDSLLVYAEKDADYKSLPEQIMKIISS